MTLTYLGSLGEDRQVKLGGELCPEDQRHVLAAFVHRFTGQHRPRWKDKDSSANVRACPVQFKDDADWLANTFFAVRNDGRLDQRVTGCESHPTWPEGRVGLPLEGEGRVSR